MNRFNLISSKFNDNKSKLYFSRPEFNKILEYYLNGVSKGNWKDYAMNFNTNEANFFIFKHSLASPDCILTKSKKLKWKWHTSHRSQDNDYFVKESFFFTM